MNDMSSNYYDKEIIYDEFPNEEPYPYDPWKYDSDEECDEECDDDD